MYRTNRITAIKTFKYSKQFDRELQIYQRLHQNGVYSVEAFTIPRLLDFHREFLVIEMQVVEPPFVLDFASAYIDQRPVYTEEEEEEWEQTFKENFGERWDTVQSIRAVFRRHKIYLTDLTPRNIRFANECSLSDSSD